MTLPEAAGDFPTGCRRRAKSGVDGGFFPCGVLPFRAGEVAVFRRIPLELMHAFWYYSTVRVCTRVFCAAIASCCGLVAECTVTDDIIVSVDAAAIAEIAPLAVRAFEIQRLALKREAYHNKELAKRGIVEVPPCRAMRYTVDTGGLTNGFSFDEWGELYIDRRFVTTEELRVINQIEAWIKRHFPSKVTKVRQPRTKAGKPGVPVFRGFEDARYQKHDALIQRLVDEFNANKAQWCGGTKEQAAKIGDLTPAIVKAHMIEESGGNGPSSKAAWQVDPMQVNVPGDWGAEKRHVGLNKPRRRNEGNVEGNIRAAIKYLSRKGFGASGQPASARPTGYFDGWETALRRYNGRRDRTATDRCYNDEYSAKIMKRARNPGFFVPIETKLKNKKRK